MVELVIAWSGNSMGKKFEWGRGPIFEKRVLTSLARKIPKNLCHSAIHQCSSFAHAGKAWELFLTSTILPGVCFLHVAEASCMFILHVFAHFPNLACPENPFWCCSTSGKGVFSFWEVMAVVLALVMP